jgi:photosystem II stability/assembly factor-like uncharacterized protein
MIYMQNEPQDAQGARAFVGGDLHSLAADPATGRLYVGGHQGVAASDDGGKNWTQLDTLNDADAMGWAFTDGAVLVGGHPGISVSTDGGRTFERANEGLPATDIHGLGSDGETLYAASPQVGILTSTDGGQTWDVVTDRAGQSFMGRILVDPDDPSHLVAPDMGSGAVESTDGGRTWSALGGVQGAMWVSWETGDAEHLIVSAIGQAVESTDGGATWNPMEIPGGASIVEIDPTDPRTLYAAVHEGQNAVVWTSTDAGETWTKA